MVEAAEARQSPNLRSSVSAPRHRPPGRCRLAEAQLRTVVVVVGDVPAEKPSEMPLVSDDDVVEELAAHAADPALGDAALPRAAVGGLVGLMPKDRTVATTWVENVESRSKIR